MTQNTSLRDNSLDWWYNKPFQEKIDLCIKYFSAVKVFTSDGFDKLTDERIETIYRKEHGIEDEVKTDTIEHIPNKYFPNNREYLEISNNIQSKTETLEEAAKAFLEKLDEETGTMWTEDDEEIVNAFVSFTTQQKEKDKAIIQELLVVIQELQHDLKYQLSAKFDPKTAYNYPSVQKSIAAITKAEQYLKQ